MFDKLKDLAGKAGKAMTSAATMVGDLNNDGKVDEQDAKLALDWAKRTASDVGDEATDLAKAAVSSKMAKDAATGAAIGAVIAVPVPVIGPIVGAAVGAGLGVYKNLTSSGSDVPAQIALPVDRHAELLKLDDLLKKGIISEAEFNTQKRRILK